MKTKNTIRFAALLMLTAVSNLTALVVYQPLDTAAPPGALGGYTMVAFDDSSTLAVETSAVPVPPGAEPTGSLEFQTPLTHLRVGMGWETWSHSFSGDVYWLDVVGYSTDSVTLMLPTNTKAFYFYVEPNFFGLPNDPAPAFVFDFKATNTASEEFTLLGEEIFALGGASGFGVYTDDPANSSLTTITITGTDTWPDGFAIGEFGINGQPPPPGVPDSGMTVLLLACASVALLFARRRCAR